MVRMLAADFVLAMVAVALLVCNIRGDHAVFLPIGGGSVLPWADRPRWDHGWPLLCLERYGPVVGAWQDMEGLVRDEIPRFPLRVSAKEDWTFNVTALAIDVLVGLAMLGSTAYATRRWLQTGMRPFQVSLLSLLTLLIVPAFVYLFSELPGILPHVLLAAFLWLHPVRCHGAVCQAPSAPVLEEDVNRVAPPASAIVPPRWRTPPRVADSFFP